jgi:hypothetical protein
MFCRIFGADSKPTSLSRREWDRFIADRRAERVAPKGAELGKSVGARIIAYDLITLRAVLNWATMVSDGEGGFLLDRNPLKDLPLPRNESPARRVLTAEQYLALRTAAATFDNPRVGVFLSSHTKRGTGPRRSDSFDRQTSISSGAWYAGARSATRSDLSTRRHSPTRQWRSFAQNRRVWPRSAMRGCSPAARGGGSITKDAAMHYWKRLAEQAGLPAGARYGWHSCRRKFATELKQRNLKDLCALGGWKAANTLLRCYIAPDEGTQREALAQRRELRSG